jgi:hypothetical protein
MLSKVINSYRARVFCLIFSTSILIFISLLKISQLDTQAWINYETFGQPRSKHFLIENILIAKVQPVGVKNVFFVDTYRMKSHKIERIENVTTRQACAVESAGEWVFESN